MCSEHLKRLELTEVDEDDYQTQNLKHVNVFEAINKDGNLFPEADPN